VLFSNLDEVSNKGLVKGLIKLAHNQDKKIQLYSATLNKLKSQYKNEMGEKDKIIKQLDEDLNNLRRSLKGCKKYLFINFNLIYFFF